MSKENQKSRIKDLSKDQQHSFTIHNLPETEGFEGRLTKPKTKQEWFNFLVENKAYPYFSSKGKIYFIQIEKQEWKRDQFLETIQESIKVLGIKTKKDCQLLRQKIREELEKRHEYKPPIRKWSKYERPREKLIKYGADKLSNAELLAILLRTGLVKKNVIELAQEILQKYGDSFRKLDTTSMEELEQIKGLGIAKIAQVKAALEISKRLSREKFSAPQKKIKTAQEIVEFCFPYMKDLKKEVFRVLLLDGGNRLLKEVDISVGSLTGAIVHPREVFNPALKYAIKEQAASIILVHNHPSGNPKPSERDIKITNRLIRASKIIGIKILDHVIIGDNKDNWTSFAEQGLIKE